MSHNQTVRLPPLSAVLAAQTALIPLPPAKKRRTKDPNAPKHPMSPFLFYLAEVRPLYTARYPGSRVGPISKMIAAAWKQLSPDQKHAYEQRAAQDKQRYAQEMDTYLANKHAEQLARARAERTSSN